MGVGEKITAVKAASVMICGCNRISSTQNPNRTVMRVTQARSVKLKGPIYWGTNCEVTAVWKDAADYNVQVIAIKPPSVGLGCPIVVGPLYRCGEYHETDVADFEDGCKSAGTS